MFKDIKELAALLKLLNKHGVTSFKHGELSMQLGKVADPDAKSITDEKSNPLENFPQGELTQDQLVFYSAGGLPENDPENTEN